MFELTATTPSSDVEVEFDAYVPVTATWPAYHDSTVVPIYTRCIEEHRLLELKFHPGTREIAELVLVNAPGMQRQERPFAQPVEGPATGFRLRQDGQPPEVARLSVTAFDDCLLMDFSATPVTAWAGTGQLFFGTEASGDVGAVGVRWTEAERRLVLDRGSA